MDTLNISLPTALRSFVEHQVDVGGYGDSSEYLRALIRRDRDRSQLRGLLLDGANSPPVSPADASYFKSLRDRVRDFPAE